MTSDGWSRSVSSAQGGNMDRVGHWSLVMDGRLVARGITHDDAVRLADEVDPERRQRTFVQPVAVVDEAVKAGSLASWSGGFPVRTTRAAA